MMTATMTSKTAIFSMLKYEENTSSTNAAEKNNDKGEHSATTTSGLPTSARMFALEDEASGIQ